MEVLHQALDGEQLLAHRVSPQAAAPRSSAASAIGHPATARARGPASTRWRGRPAAADPQRRALGPAAVDHGRAARGERAALDRLQQVRRRARDGEQAVDRLVRVGDRPQQGGRVRVARRGQQHVGRAVLDDAAAVHDVELASRCC